MKPLIGIGYWKSEVDTGMGDFPDPHTLVNPAWKLALFNEGVLECLLKYLMYAPQYQEYRGYSSCRFACGISDPRMGSRELTDGVYVWPEGLAHYVDKHDVMLPDAFIEHCINNCWENEQTRLTFDFWANATREHNIKYAFSNSIIKKDLVE